MRTGDTFLESVEGSSFDSTPAPPCVIPSQIEEWANVFREALDEPPIEVGESQEGLHLLLVYWGRPVFNTSNLDQVHSY